MKRKDAQNRLAIFAVSAAIWALLCAVWGMVWMIYYNDFIMRPFGYKGNWLIMAMYGVILYFTTHLYGGYRVRDYRRGDVIFSASFAMFATNCITYLQTCLVNRAIVDPFPFVWMTLLDFILIWIWATLANKLYLFLFPPRKLLVIYGGTSMTQSLIIKMSERDEKYLIREVVNIDEGVEQVFDKIDRYKSVLISDVPSQYRNMILKYCYEKSIRVYMTPKISDILIRGASGIHLFDTPLLLSRNNGLGFNQRVLKRTVDICLSALGIVISSPFMLLVALGIKLCDGGPVFYRQVRLTEGGREFSLLKFRSMVVDAEKGQGAVLASQADDRITPVGKFIRKTRLDELPQLINILMGDMSLVGPRPERPELAREYMETMEEFSFRLKVKAGLTGYAQVLGKYNTTPYDKLKLDLMYICSYSLLLDFKLILQTIKILFLSSSTEGIEKGKRHA